MCYSSFLRINALHHRFHRNLWFDVSLNQLFPAPGNQAGTRPHQKQTNRIKFYATCHRIKTFFAFPSCCQALGGKFLRKLLLSVPVTDDSGETCVFQKLIFPHPAGFSEIMEPIIILIYLTMLASAHQLIMSLFCENHKKVVTWKDCWIPFGPDLRDACFE